MRDSFDTTGSVRSDQADMTLPETGAVPSRSGVGELLGLIRSAPPALAEIEKRAWNESLANKLWVISLHSAACRRWLALDPPRLDEAAQTLMRIEEACRGIGLSQAQAASVQREPARIPTPNKRSFDDIVRQLLVTEGALREVIVTTQDQPELLTAGA